ncbi:MAG TPA: polymer-forming cytoskeletal protein [Acidimicrobiia bacterium]|nr:polymer-forming cytoskeletal protein [Acidimicrobiia bacterium]
MAHSHRRRRRLRWLGLVALFVVTGATVAVAQDTQLGGKIQAGGQITISADETIDGDLYASAGRVLIEGTVDGDLIVGAGQVTISGEVGGDVMASAGTVDISGEVVGDARVAAGQSTLSGSIGEDLFVASGLTTISDSGEVGEDLVFGSGRMAMNGTVGGDVLGVTGDYDRQGTVAGTENVTIREVEPPTAADRILDAIQRLISLLLVAALFLWLAPRYIEEPSSMLRQRPLASLGIGIATVIAFAVVVLLVILVATLLALGVGLVGLDDLVGAIIFTALVTVAVLSFLFFLAAVFGAPAWVGMALGNIAMSLDSPARRWWALIIGLIVVVALTSIPVVGGWIGLLVVLFGLGAAVLSLRPRRTTATIVETPAVTS